MRNLVCIVAPLVVAPPLYRGTDGRHFDAGYGICAQPPSILTAPTATVVAVPAAGQALFYLVTARNRLPEESTRGFTSVLECRAPTRRRVHELR